MRAATLVVVHILAAVHALAEVLALAVVRTLAAALAEDSATATVGVLPLDLAPSAAAVLGHRAVPVALGRLTPSAALDLSRLALLPTRDWQAARRTVLRAAYISSATGMVPDLAMVLGSVATALGAFSEMAAVHGAVISATGSFTLASLATSPSSSTSISFHPPSRA